MAPVTIAIVKNTKVVGGRTYLNCWDPSTGENFSSVPVVSLSGDNTFCSFRPAVSEDPLDHVAKDPAASPNVVQAILLRKGPRRAPYCIGYVRKATLPTAAKECPPTATGADRSTLDYATDHTIKNKGATVIVGNDGSIVMETPPPAPPLIDGNIRMQLLGTGKVRISRNFVATDSLVLATPMLAYLVATELHIAGLNSAINAMLSVEVTSLELIAVLEALSAAMKLVPPMPSAMNSGLVSKVIEISPEFINVPGGE